MAGQGGLGEVGPAPADVDEFGFSQRPYQVPRIDMADGTAAAAEADAFLEAFDGEFADTLDLVNSNALASRPTSKCHSDWSRRASDLHHHYMLLHLPPLKFFE